jgi:hypothetical protein
VGGPACRVALPQVNGRLFVVWHESISMLRLDPFALSLDMYGPTRHPLSPPSASHLGMGQ